MSKTIVYPLIFGAGVAAGILATKAYFQKDYDSRIHEYEKDIESVRNMYKEKMAEIEKKKTEEAQNIAAKNRQKPNLESLAHYHDIIENEGYTDYSGISTGKKSEEKKPVVDDAADDIFIITPDEAGEEYELQAVTCYADGTITDCYDELMENPDDIIGTEYKDHFGEYANDTVFVRNDRLKCDYEISKDNRNFEDVVAEGEYYDS